MKDLKIYSVGFIFYLAFVFGGCAQNASFEAAVADFQREKNEQFADSVESPLPADERAAFSGLPFYPANEKFRVQADLKRLDGKPIEMPTTTDRIARYQPYGELSFEIDGKSFVLTVYQPVAFPSIKKLEEQPPLFLPYTDLTNGDETYGGGRYIDIERQEGESWILDFNHSYNPYCAYNDRYSCPVPPKENHLEIRVEAGVRYDAHH